MRHHDRLARALSIVALIAVGGCKTSIGDRGASGKGDDLSDPVADAGPGGGGGDDGGSPVDAGEMIVADATPAQGCAVQLLANPAFDDGAVGWAEVNGPINFPDGQVAITPHSGTRVAMFGRSVQADQKLSQVVAIPATATALRFRAFTCFATDRFEASTDAVRVELLGVGDVLLEGIATFGDEDATPTCNWTERLVPLADARAGQTVEIAFSAHSDNSLDTSFYFDSMALDAAVPCP